jgi:heat shock protein HslJ
MKLVNDDAPWQSAVRLLAATGMAAFLLAGCALAPVAGDAGGQPPLAGTAWQLVAYRAGVAGSAELRPARPDQYQLRFGADGRLSAQVDCNRGTGAWTADASSGSLALGPLGTTRMMCPPSPLDGHLPGELEAVRSYRIVDGRLHLALAGGAGIYTWERAQP